MFSLVMAKLVWIGAVVVIAGVVLDLLLAANELSTFTARPLPCQVIPNIVGSATALIS